MFDIRSLADHSYEITDRARFNAIPIYHPTPDELAKPAVPIVVADYLYTLTHEAQVYFERLNRADELQIKWIGQSLAEPEAVKVLVR